MGTVFAVNRRNLTALGSVTVLLVIAYLLIPRPVVQYGVWLVVFFIWMTWFVFAGIEWLSKADF